MNTFELKGSLFTLTAIRLKSADLPTLKTELETKVAQAPSFFENAPIVIDLHPIQSINPPVDFEELKSLLKSFKMIPIGVRNGSKEHHDAAVKAGLALLPNVKSTETTEADTKVEKVEAKDDQSKTEKEEKEPGTLTKIITEPVRSGKQIYVKGGDLLVLAPVSHGAEILADGNIHVYAPLRGRALAGVQGNTKARIFCKQLEAELISIAGHYKISDELDSTFGKNDSLKHIFLENDEIKVTEV